MSPSSSEQPKPLSERKVQPGSEHAKLRQWAIDKAHEHYQTSGKMALEIAKAMERQVLGEDPWPKGGDDES